MSDEKKKEDLAQEESKVEEVTVKIDASAVKDAVKEGITDGFKEIAPEALPGAPASDLSKGDEKDFSKYSIRTAILKKALQKEGNGKFDGIELEMHQEAEKEARETGQALMGLGIPSAYLHKRADLQASVDAAGGYTVDENTTGFIESLKNSMATIKAGAKMMAGLVGDVSIPRLTTDSVATWRTEGGIATESDPVFDAVTLTPHRLTTYTVYSMQLLRQSTLDITKIVSDTLFYSIANALEAAGLEGSGTSQVPQGILNQSNVNDATHGSSSATAANWKNIVQMEQMIASDNALAAKMAYVMKTTAAGKLKTTPKVSSTDSVHIWENDPLLGGTVNGYPALTTNVFTDDTIIFGDWTQLMYGQWGGLDLLVNPFSLDTYAQVRVVIAGYFDVALRHGQSFSRIDDLIIV